MSDKPGQQSVQGVSQNQSQDPSVDVAAAIGLSEEMPASAPAATVPVQVKYELEHLAMSESAAESPEEIEMLRVELPDPQVEPGIDLLQSLEAIPEKMAFKIGEAADMVGVKQYVLRYWETEFEMLRPRKSKNNQRVYSRKDVETAMMIKKLLYDDRFSIEGARAALRQLKNQVKEDRGLKRIVESQETAVTKLRGLVGEIQRIRDIFL